VWGAPITAVVTVAAVPLAVWLFAGATFGFSDPGEVYHLRQVLQREGARWSLWIAGAASVVAVILTLRRAALREVRVRWSTAVDAVAVLAWSAFVRFVLTQPNILTDGGSGYGRLGRQWVGGWQGLPALIEALFPAEPRFMWSIIRVPWVLAAFAPPFLLLLARALGFARGTALFAGVALASLPLHAAMYSSDFETGPLLAFELLGLALVAAAVRFERDELAAAGSALLAYTCWGRPDAPVVGGALLAIVLPTLRRWRTRPLLVLAIGWFLVNAVGSYASARALDVGGSIRPRVIPMLPLRFLRLQPIIPFWLLLPLPFGVVRLLRGAAWRLGVVAVGAVAGLLPLSVSVVGNGDATQSYMEYFRYGTWALPWIVLVAAEGMNAGVGVLARRGPSHAPRLEVALGATIVAACMATPLLFRGYLAREYGPRAEEAVFREALRHVPEGCGLIVPDDDRSRRGGSIEITRRYVYIAEEAAARGESRVDPRSVIGATALLRSPAQVRTLRPTASAPDGDRTPRPCWYYFRGSYCYTGLVGRGSSSCAKLERHAVLEPVLSRDILYISHRLVTRPDLSDRPLYDPAQSLVLSKIVGWRGQ
jgi:hypothetical protein